MARQAEEIASNAMHEFHMMRAQARWNLIRPQLEPNDRSLLDVGCAHGYITLLAAESGLFSLGIEPKMGKVRRALKMRDENSLLTFLQYTLTPETVDSLPLFDVIIFLSAHHTIQRHCGKAFADQLLEGIGRRARRKLFFEPPSSGFKNRYKNDAPELVDGDPDSIIPYFTDFLKERLGDYPVEVVGTSVASRGEADRYMFMIDFGTRV